MLITLFRIDKSNRYHYFMIHDRQASLFEPYTLTTSYMINHGKARDRHFTFENRADMDKKTAELFKSKIKAGYKYLYGFDRTDSSLLTQLVTAHASSKTG